jgi:glycosyltransferase involved in cell wall biosynthesis
VERIVEALAFRLKQEGHQVVVITTSRGLPSGTYDQNLDGIQIYRYPEYRLPFMETAVSPGMIGQVLGQRFDVLHVHGMTPTITDVCILIGKLKRKPVVLSYHYDAETTGRLAVLLETTYERFATPIIRLADVLTILSDSYAKTSKVLQRVRAKLITVPGGVDLRKFSPAPNDGNQKTPPIILFVGKIIHYKGVEYLIDAMPTVLARVPNARLILSGRSNSQRYTRMIANRIAKSPAREAIWWEDDWVDREALIRRLRECSVLVLPSVSRREAFGMVLIEAMSVGKPVIATSIPGPSDIVQDGVNGFLVPPRDSAKLAEAIVSMLGDKTLSTKMGRMSRRLARQYAWDQVTAQHVRIIESCVQHSADQLAQTNDSRQN